MSSNAATPLDNTVLSLSFTLCAISNFLRHSNGLVILLLTSKNLRIRHFIFNQGLRQIRACREVRV